MKKIRRAQSRLQKRENEESVINSSEGNLKESLVNDPEKMQRSLSAFTNDDASGEIMRRS